VQFLPPALAGLAAFRQFLVYVLVPSATRPGKTDKLPVSPLTGYTVSAHDPAHWVDAQTACNVATSGGRHTASRSPCKRETGCFSWTSTRTIGARPGWSPLAQQILRHVPGRGRGTVAVAKGFAYHRPRQRARPRLQKRSTLGLEFYTEARFIALTGLHAVGDVNTDHTQALHTMTAHLFPPGAGKHDGAFRLTSEPVPEWRGPVDDEELLRRALNSRSAGGAFGVRATFADLWERERRRPARRLPVAGQALRWQRGRRRLGCASSVLDRQARRAHCGPHAAIRPQAGQVGPQRATTTSRAPFARSSRAAATCCRTSRPSPRRRPCRPRKPPSQRSVEGQTFLGAEAQRDLFKGCVYVRDRHRVIVPGGHMLKPEQFRVAFGGYVFAMDDVNQKHEPQRVGGVHAIANPARAHGRHHLLSPAGPGSWQHFGGRRPHARQHVLAGGSAPRGGRRGAVHVLLRKPLAGRARPRHSVGVHGRMRAVQGPQIPMVARYAGRRGQRQNDLERVRRGGHGLALRTLAQGERPPRTSSTAGLPDKVFVAVEELQSADSHDAKRRRRGVENDHYRRARVYRSN
jgi:hypothetical protein